VDLMGFEPMSYRYSSAVKTKKAQIKVGNLICKSVIAAGDGF